MCTVLESSPLPHPVLLYTIKISMVLIQRLYLHVQVIRESHAACKLRSDHATSRLLGRTYNSYVRGINDFHHDDGSNIFPREINTRVPGQEEIRHKTTI